MVCEIIIGLIDFYNILIYIILYNFIVKISYFELLYICIIYILVDCDGNYFKVVYKFKICFFSVILINNFCVVCNVRFY